MTIVEAVAVVGPYWWWQWFSVLGIALLGAMISRALDYCFFNGSPSILSFLACLVIVTVLWLGITSYSIFPHLFIALTGIFMLRWLIVYIQHFLERS